MINNQIDLILISLHNILHDLQSTSKTIIYFLQILENLFPIKIINSLFRKTSNQHYMINIDKSFEAHRFAFKMII